MRRSHVPRGAAATEINLTPLIDMAFILVIFLLVTSSFIKEAGIEVNRPSARTAERTEQGNIVIAVTAAGEVWLDNRPVDIRTVRSRVERLHAENPEGAVIIAADKDSRTGLAVQVLDQVRLAGVTRVSIAASAEAAGGGVD